MAKILKSPTQTYRISKWLGLHEAPDGDTKLKMGEAVVAQNWRVTRDGNLKRRSGTVVARTHTNCNIMGMWSGTVKYESLVYATNGTIYCNIGTDSWYNIGTYNLTSSRVHFFPFDGKLYMLDGTNYKSWNGDTDSTFADVTGYVPIVVQNSPPAGGGDLLENINRLNGMRRVWFNANGTATAFVLPETPSAVYWVKNLTDGSTISDWTLSGNTVTLQTAPASGSNNIEIKYGINTTYRSQVTDMHYSELYNGANDNRIFLYGDGTNKTIYSGILHETGKPSAEYFPDLYEIDIGESSTPITGLIRQYSRLIAFKTSETWSIAYTSVTLESGSVTAGFYCNPINKAIGNEAMGQVQLVLNAPYTLCQSAVYEWRSNSSYNANLTIDERQAKRISDRVSNTLSTFSFDGCTCWDDNKEQEFYICYGSRALIYNYANDTWYTFSGIYSKYFARFKDKLYVGTSDGYILIVSDCLGDYTTASSYKGISAWYETGSMAFTAENLKKYIAEMWISSKPLANGGLTIRILSDNGEVSDVSVYAAESSEGNIDFSDFDFTAVSFGSATVPEATRRRIVARRFDYLKMIFIATGEQNGTVSNCLFNITYDGKKM